MYDGDEELESEAEGQFGAFETALLGIVGAGLLALKRWDAKGINALSLKVKARAERELARRREKIMGAALRDMVGQYVLDAMADCGGASGVVDDATVERALKRGYAAAGKSYGRLVNELRFLCNGAVDGTRRAYLEAARKAAGRVDEVGEQAIRQAVADLAQKGITAYSYQRRDGVTVNVPVDVGIRRAMQGNDNTVDRMMRTVETAAGITGLVEVSATAGARKSHADWQGEVYQLEGSGEYENFYDACRWGDKADGIGGYNCGHRVAVYYPQEGRRFKDPLEGTGYTQEQAREVRAQHAANQNGLRKLKREREALKAAGLDTREVSRRIRARTAEMERFVSEHPDLIKRERHKETIFGKCREKAGAFGTVHIDEKAAMRVARAKAERAARAEAANAAYRQRVGNAAANVVKAGKQNKHIPGTKEYAEKLASVQGKGFKAPSRLTVTVEEAQELVNRYAGTGIAKTTASGDWNKREKCVSDSVIGYYVDKEGVEHPTKAFMIHYSKKDAHIVPADDSED